MALDDLTLTNATHGEPATVLAVRDIASHLSGLKDYAGRLVFADGWVRSWEDSIKEVSEAACIVTQPTESYAVDTVPRSFQVQGVVELHLWLYYTAPEGSDYREQRERLVRHVLRALSYPAGPASAADDTDITAAYSQPDATADDFGFRHRIAYWDWARQTLTVEHDPSVAPSKADAGWHVTHIPMAIEVMANFEVAE